MYKFEFTVYNRVVCEVCAYFTGYELYVVVCTVFQQMVSTKCSVLRLFSIESGVQVCAFGQFPGGCGGLGWDELAKSPAGLGLLCRCVNKYLKVVCKVCAYCNKCAKYAGVIIMGFPDF